jgi:hypothetical protein
VTPNAVYLRQRNKKARRVARSGERRAKGRDWDGIFRDVKAGQPVLDVAAKYNVPASTIHTRLRRLEAEEAPTVREYAVNDEEAIEKISATIIKINGTPGEVRDFLKEM